MLRHKIFVVLACLQVSSFWAGASIKYRLALAAEAAGHTDEKHETSSSGDGTPHTAREATVRDQQASGDAHETPSGKQESSQGEQGPSAVPVAQPNPRGYTPSFELLKYPYPAVADRLNVDATYSLGGTLYTFVGRVGDMYAFDRVSDKSRSTFEAVTQFEVVHDPVAQLEKDMTVIPTLQGRTSELLFGSTAHVTALQKSVEAFRTTAASVNHQASEETVLRALETMEKQLSRMQTELDTVTSGYTAIETILREGLTLCEDMEQRARQLTHRLYLGQKVRALCTSLHDESNALSWEMYDYSKTVKGAREEIETIRNVVKLMSDLREVRVRFGEFLTSTTATEQGLKAVVQQIEELTSTVTAPEEVLERRMRAKTLLAALGSFEKQVESLTGDAALFIQRYESLQPFKTMCAQFNHMNIQIVVEEINRFQNLTKGLEATARTLENHSQRATRALLTLREYTVSYQVMESDLFRSGMDRVKEKMQAVDEGFSAAGTVGLKVAEEQLSRALQTLMEAVHLGTLEDVESKLQDAVQLMEARSKACAVAEEILDSHLAVVQELQAEVRRLESFVSSEEEEEILEGARRHLSDRRDQFQAHRHLLRSSVLPERCDAAVERVVTLFLDMAEKHLSDGEAKQASIKKQKDVAVKDAVALARLTKTCEEISESIASAAAASAAFLRCRESPFLHETMKKVPVGGGDSLHDRLQKRWSLYVKWTERVEASLALLTSEIERLKAGMKTQALRDELGQLFARVAPFVDNLKRGCSQGEGAAEGSRGRCEVEEGVEALEQLLRSPPAGDIQARATGALFGVLQAALRSAAGHVDTATAAERTAAQILAHQRGGRRAQDPVGGLKDLPPEERAAAAELKEHVSLAGDALIIFQSLVKAPGISASILNTPFTWGDISEETLTAAAHTLETKVRALEDRLREIYEAIEAHQAWTKRQVQMHLKDVLQSMEAALEQLKSKKDLVTSKHHRTRLEEQERVYTRVRDEVFACLSRSTVQLRDVKACFSALLRTILSSATDAVERAQDLETQAEELEASSPTDAGTLEKIRGQCNGAIEEAGIAEDALNLYDRTSALTLVEAAGTCASGGAEETGVSLKEAAETTRRGLDRVVEGVRRVREQVQARSEAVAGSFRASVSRALAAAQRSLEEVRGLVGGDAADQQFFVDLVETLEKMLALAPQSGDVTEKKRQFTDVIQKMERSLIATAAGGLNALRQQIAEAEDRMREMAADAPASLSDIEDRRKAVCEELPQRLRLVKRALQLYMELEEIENLSSSSEKERCQQLLVEIERLEDQLRVLCEEAARRSDSIAQEAQQKLETMNAAVDEILAPLVDTLLAAGDPKQTASHLKDLIAALTALRTRASAPSFPVEVDQQRKQTLNLLLEMISELQELCNEDIVTATSSLEEAAPRLLLTVIRQDLEDAVLGGVSRCQKVVNFIKLLLRAYTVVDGDLQATKEDHSSGARVSTEEESLSVLEKVKFLEWLARVEQIGATLQALKKRLGKKIAALQQAGSRVVREVLLRCEDAIVKIDTEGTGDMDPTATCEDGEARTNRIKEVLKSSVHELKTLAPQWGTQLFVDAIRRAVGRMLSTLLQRAEMHVEAGRSMAPTIQKCLAEGTSCDVLGEDVEAAQTTQAQWQSRIQGHASAAAEWLKLYDDCTTGDDVSDIAQETPGGPSSLPLPEWAVKLLMEARAMEELEKLLSSQISLRAATVAHVVHTRLEALIRALKIGIDTSEELLQVAVDQGTLKHGENLKRNLQDALSKVQELEGRSQRVATPSESEELVASVLQMLVTFASSLVEEGTKKEQVISDCLKHSPEYPVPQAASDMGTTLASLLDTLVACTEVSSLALSILVECTASSFTADIARKTPWLKHEPSSPTLSQRADTLWFELERIQTQIPVFAAQIREQRESGTYQTVLGQIVSLISSGFQELNEVERIDEDTLQQRNEKLGDLQEALRGLQGAAVPPRVEAEVSDLFKMALTEATRQTSLAKEKLEAVEQLVDDPDVDVITTKYLTQMKSSAETGLGEAYGRVKVAKRLLAAVDGGLDGSERLRETLEKLAGAKDMSAADEILSQTELCKSTVNRLRARVADRQAWASEIATESLENLVEVLKHYVGELEREATTRNFHEVVDPLTTRFQAFLGLVKSLRATWDFPASLSDYISLMEACAVEFVTAASTTVSTAAHLRDMGNAHTLPLPSPIATQQGGEQLITQAYYEQGGNLLHIASVALDGLWSVLTVGEVTLGGDGKTVTVALDSATRAKLVSDATRVAEEIAKIKEQLSVSRLKSIVQSQQELLVELATDRISQIIDIFDATRSHLASRLQRCSHSGARKIQVMQELELFTDRMKALKLYQSAPGFPFSSKELHKQTAEALYTCLQRAEENLTNGKQSVMQAALLLGGADDSAAPEEKADTLLRAKSATTHASDSLVLAAMALETFRHCTRAAMVSKLAERTPAASGGTSLRDTYRTLLGKARELGEEIDSVQHDVDRNHEAAVAGADGGQSVQTPGSQGTPVVAQTFDVQLTTPTASQEEAAASTSSTSSLDFDPAVVEELKRRLQSAADQLQKAADVRVQVEKCIATTRECDELLSSAVDITAASQSVHTRLMHPVLLAKEDLRAAIGIVIPTDAAQDTSAGLPQEVEAEDVQEQGEGAVAPVFPLSELSPTVRERLHLVDPTFAIVQQAEKLLVATKEAEEDAVKTNLALTAALVLRQVQAILEKLAKRVEEEHTTSGGGGGEYVRFLKEELQVVSQNVLDVHNRIGSRADVNDCGPLLEHTMRRIVRVGQSLVAAAKQAAETADETLREVTPGSGTDVVRVIRQVQQSVDLSASLVSLTRSLANSLYDLTAAASALQVSEDVELFDMARDLAPIISVAEELSRQADSVDAILATLRRTLRDRDLSDSDKFKRAVKALIDILQRADQQLLKGVQNSHKDAAIIAARSVRIGLRAHANPLRTLLEESVTRSARQDLQTAVVAVGRKLIDSAEVTLGNAERLEVKVKACLNGDGGDTSCTVSDATSVKDACTQISELVTLASIVLRALEDCGETSGLVDILNKVEHDETTSILERGHVLRRRADALTQQLPVLRDRLLSLIFGTSDDATVQRALLVHAIGETVSSLDHQTWLLEELHHGVDNTKKQLTDVVSELQSMGDTPQESHVHAAAAKAFAVALQLVSDLTEEAQERADRLADCFRSSGMCTRSGEPEGEAPEMKQEARTIAALVSMAQTALQLGTLPERQACFRGVADTEQQAGHSLKERGGVLRAKLEAQQALVQSLLHGSQRREEEIREECQAVLLRALLKAINSASDLVVPGETEQARANCISALTTVMDELQELVESSSLSEFQSAAKKALLTIVEVAETNIKAAETSSVKAAELLKTAEFHKDETKRAAAIAALRDASASGALADVALQAFFASQALPLMRDILRNVSVEVEGEGDSKTQVTMLQYGDQLLYRLRKLKDFLQRNEKQSTSISVSDLEVADAMATVLREGINRLGSQEFQPSTPHTRSRRAALEARLGRLQDAARGGTGEALENALVHELAEAVLDISRTLAHEGSRETLDALGARVDRLAKNLLESVDDLTEEAEKVTAKHVDAAEALDWASVSGFLITAERALDTRLNLFINEVKALEEKQQHLALQAGYAAVSRGMAEAYLGIQGMKEILKRAAQRGKDVPSTADIENVVKEVAVGAIEEIQLKAQHTSHKIEAANNLARRGRDRLQRALAHVVPLCLGHLKAEVERLLREEQRHADQLRVIQRLASNAVNKLLGKELQRPSGDDTDVGLEGEDRMSPVDLLNKAVKMLSHFKKALDYYSSRVLTVLSHTDDLLRIVQKGMGGPAESPFAQARRLSDKATLHGARPILVQIKEQLQELLQRISNMRQQAEEEVKGASGKMKKYLPQSERSRIRQLLPVVLGVGLPLVLLAVGACGYYHYRRRKGKIVTDLTTLASGSEFQSTARPPDASGELQVSRYDFVGPEPDSTFSAFDPAELSGVRSLTNLETPNAGIPDTTQRQYMVDEHHVVATHMRKEQQCERVAF